MSAVPFGELLLPDGRLSVFACGAGIRHVTARCPRDVGPFTFSRAVRLVLADGSTHHALVEPSELAGYADRVDSIQKKRERLDSRVLVYQRVKRAHGQPVWVTESEADFFARVYREACGMVDERDKAQGYVERVREPVRAAVSVNLRTLVDQKGEVTDR